MTLVTHPYYSKSSLPYSSSCRKAHRASGKAPVGRVAPTAFVWATQVGTTPGLTFRAIICPNSIVEVIVAFWVRGPPQSPFIFRSGRSHKPAWEGYIGDYDF
jgi:hypothetical protein